VSDEELEARLQTLGADDGDLVIAHAEFLDAQRMFPDQPSINAGQARQPDPRRLKALRKYEQVRRETFALEAELAARRASEHRKEFLDGRAQRDLGTQGLHGNQRLKEAHDRALQLDLYDDAALVKKQMNKPYIQRPWARSVVEKALAEQELDNTPPIRQIGAIPSDLKAQRPAGKNRRW
jgi:hypothetical protein